MADIFEALSQIRKASDSGGTAVADPADDTLETPRSGDIFSALDNIRENAIPAKGLPPDQINPPIPPTTFAGEMVKNTTGAIAQGVSELATNLPSAIKNVGSDIHDALAEIRKTSPSALESGATDAYKAAMATPMIPGGGQIPGVPGITLGEAAQKTMAAVNLPFQATKAAIKTPLESAAKTLGIENVPLIGIRLPVPGSKDITLKQGIDFLGEAGSWILTPEAIKAVPELAEKLLMKTVRYPAMPIAKVIPFDRLRQLQGGAPPLPKEVAVMQGLETKVKFPRFGGPEASAETGVQPYSIYDQGELPAVLKRDAEFDVALYEPKKPPVEPAPAQEPPSQPEVTSPAAAPADIQIKPAEPHVIAPEVQVAPPTPETAPPAGAQPHIIDALDQIRNQPPAVPQPPLVASEAQALEPPPPQKGPDIPVIKPSPEALDAKGKPFALFVGNQEGVGPMFNVYGEHPTLSSGRYNHSTVALESLEKEGIPILGQEARAVGQKPTVPFQIGGSSHALAPMPSEPGPSAMEPKSEPKQPDFPATVPPTEPGPPEATHEAPIFELPEMVQLSKDLMEGKFPQVVKQIRAAGGRALGVFQPGKGIIQIRADQFKDPAEAAHTLSHEIGHLADWLPEKDIKRGNIIGRIASLQKNMKNQFMGESFETHLFNNKKFRNELISLTNRWHPFDAAQAPKKYLAYRYSAPELYAEAWSVLLNNPKFLKDTAPAFYKAFFDYLDRKPNVKALYDDLHEVIRQGKTAETRHERETAAYAKEDLAAKMRNEAKGHPLRTIWDELRESFVDANSKIISSVSRARKAGIDIPAEENPMHALEELRYSSAEMSDYAREQGAIYHRLKDNGIEWNDLGSYLKADRVINERSEMANPGGQTPKAAKEEIAILEKKYGEKFADLKAAADEMRGPGRDYLIKELEKANMVSPTLLEKIKNNKAYSPFDIIIDDTEKSLGGVSSNVGPQIYSQIGTLRDIKNPATALVMKDLSLMRAIRVQQAKLKQANWMLKHEPSWIVEAETKWNGTSHVPMEPSDKENTGLLAFHENGKIRAYYVPRTIADTFRYDPQEASLMMDYWDRMNGFFKQIFTAANPGFQVMNVPRDMSSLVMNIRGMSYTKALRYYIKTAGSAKRFAEGEHDDLVQEMLRRKVLITPQNRWSSVAHDVEMESVINRFSDKENEYKNWFTKVAGPLLDRVKMLGQMSEGISKIAGFKYLKERQADFGLSDEDVNHLIRFQAGSPPFLVAGKQSRAISRLLLFFNPHVQGYRRSFEAAHNNPGEYTAKLMKYVFLPKMLQYLAWAGVFGAATRTAYRKVSSYNHANYHVIPLGEDSNGKEIALKIPMDDTERFYGGLLWYALTSQPVAKTMAMFGYEMPAGTAAQDFTKLFSYTAGQAPNLTPGVGALSDLVQYASGHIPYDSFRGKPGIPQETFDAGGMRSHEAMLKYELNQLGAGLVYRFNTSDLQKVKSNLDKVLGAPVIGNVLSRFLMSTNFGESELITNRVAQAKQADANDRLDYREAVVQNIMAHDKPASPDDVANLYGQMMKEGLLGDALHIKKFSEFQAFYQRLQSQRLDDPYANGLLFAKSDAEKGAVLDVAKENLTDAEYKKLVGYSLSQKFIHAKTLVSDQFKKASKK